MGIQSKRLNRRLRLILALGGGVLLLLCLGGIGVVVSLYDRATEINRAAPDAVVDSYIRAALVDRDDQEALLFTCEDGPDLAAVQAFRTEIDKREQDPNIKVTVQWGALSVAADGDKRRLVTTDLVISGTTNGETRSRRYESWTFGLVEQDGWRVCSASKGT